MFNCILSAAFVSSVPQSRASRHAGHKEPRIPRHSIKTLPALYWHAHRRSCLLYFVDIRELFVFCLFQVKIIGRKGLQQVFFFSLLDLDIMWIKKFCQHSELPRKINKETSFLLHKVFLGSIWHKNKKHYFLYLDWRENSYFFHEGIFYTLLYDTSFRWRCEF